MDPDTGGAVARTIKKLKIPLIPAANDSAAGNRNMAGSRGVLIPGVTPGTTTTSFSHEIPGRRRIAGIPISESRDCDCRLREFLMPYPASRNLRSGFSIVTTVLGGMLRLSVTLDPI